MSFSQVTKNDYHALGVDVRDAMSHPTFLVMMESCKKTMSKNGVSAASLKRLNDWDSSTLTPTLVMIQSQVNKRVRS